MTRFRVKEDSKQLSLEDRWLISLYADYQKTKGRTIQKANFYVQRFIGWWPLGFWKNVSKRVINVGPGDYASQQVDLYFKCREDAKEFIKSNFSDCLILQG